MVSPAIRLLVETEFGQPIRYASDCEHLSNAIFERTGERIGITTLKRMLGFVNDVSAPRVSTLDILARYLQYENFAELNNVLGDDSDCLRLAESDILVTDTLPEGAILEIELPCPAHKMKLRHRNGQEFEVLESTLLAIKPADRLTIGSMAKGVTMIVSKHTRGEGHTLPPKAIGQLHGLLSFKVFYP